MSYFYCQLKIPILLLFAKLVLLSPLAVAEPVPPLPNPFNQELNTPGVGGDILSTLPGALIACLGLGIALYERQSAQRVRQQLETFRKQDASMGDSKEDIVLGNKDECYRWVVENSAVGVWQVDSEGHTLYMNPTMYQLLAAEGTRDFSQLSQCSLLQVNKNAAESRKFYPAILVGKDGKKRKVLVSETPMLLDGKREIIRIVLDYDRADSRDIAA